MHLAHDFLRLPRLEDHHVAVFVAQVHLPVGHERGAPDRRQHVVLPVELAGLGVEGVQEAREVRHVGDPVLDGSGRDRAAEVVTAAVPHLSLLGHVTAQARVDRPEVPHSLAVLRVLAHPDVDLVIEDDRARDDVVLGAAAAQGVDRTLGVGVELPEERTRLGLEAVDPAVAASEHHLRPALGHPEGRVRPVAVDDLLAREVALPDQLARVLVQGDEARGLWRRDVDVALVDAVAGGHVDDVAHHHRGARGQVVGKHVELPHQVELPDHVGVRLALVLLGGDPFVLSTLEAVGAEADDVRLVRGVPEPLALHEGGGAHALLRPVVHAAGGQLVGGHLPEELTIGGRERHHDALVAFDLRVALPLVVGPDEHLSVRHHRTGVALGAGGLRPLHVHPGLHVPLRWEAGLLGDHVPGRIGAEEGALGLGRLDVSRRGGAPNGDEKGHDGQHEIEDGRSLHDRSPIFHRPPTLVLMHVWLRVIGSLQP